MTAGFIAPNSGMLLPYPPLGRWELREHHVPDFQTTKDFERLGGGVADISLQVVMDRTLVVYARHGKEEVRVGHDSIYPYKKGHAYPTVPRYEVAIYAAERDERLRDLVYGQVQLKAKLETLVQSVNRLARTRPDDKGYAIMAKTVDFEWDEARKHLREINRPLSIKQSGLSSRELGLKALGILLASASLPH